ncbi:MAG: hypothetical protein OXE83_09370 [Gammaproteobacteria bacterium]|nr:hypothetical protein [Gammaproteobacteria bacterium]
MQRPRKFTSRCAIGLIGLVCALASPVQAADAPAWTQGDWDLNLRYRFEHADDTLNRKAKASTVRAGLIYRSAEVNGFSALAEVEHVSTIGGETYNDGGTNGKTQYAVIADPEGTEINQAYVQFTGLPNTTLRYGRQEIFHRKTPFHRFIGTVLFRQNHQSMDGFRVQSSPIENLAFDGGYIHNVNRIFGEDNDLPNRSDHDLDGLLARLEYTGIEGMTIEGYFYDLDFTNALALSTQTFGAKVWGDIPMGEGWVAHYAAERSQQNDTGDNPHDLSLAYWGGSVGLTIEQWNGITAKLNHERMEGDGTMAFQFPLATLHAHQGWADKFLSTPAAGLRDTYVTVQGRAGPVGLLFAWRSFEAEMGGFDYGWEWNFQATAKPTERLSVGFKVADYHADGNPLNTGATARDTTKFWAWMQLAL